MRAARRVRAVGLVVALGGALGLGGCGEGEGNGGTDAGAHELACDANHPDVSTQQIFTGVFEPKCNQCHTAGATGTIFMADTVEELQAAVGMDSAYPGEVKIVDANRAENSSLFLKISGGSPKYFAPDGTRVGGPMPQGGTLTDEERKLFKDWICSGAN